MTASKKIETPIMKIAVTGNTKEAAEALARKLNPVVLMDIVQENPTLNESMKVNKELRVYNIKLKIKVISGNMTPFCGNGKFLGSRYIEKTI